MQREPAESAGVCINGRALLTPGAVRREVGTLKELLREYRFFPGLSVHWVMFGSNGHQARPQGGGMLQHYTTCENTAFGAVKTIVNTYHVQHVLRQPHNFRYKCAALVAGSRL